jgi:hypothetical protein
LNALSTIGGAGGSVNVTLSANVYTVTFGGALADVNVPAMTASGSGGTATMVSTLVDGMAGRTGAPAYFIGLTSTDPFSDVHLAFAGVYK